MSKHGYLVLVAFVLLATPSLLVAQDEAALKNYFEGKTATLRLDMPGTSDGVDLEQDEVRPLDFEDYQRSLKRYGVAIHAGETAVITLIKVKKDIIEFHFGGGGFGTFGDDTSTSSNIKLLDKSDREKDLEKRLKDEKDPERRKAWQSELDTLREKRERENKRLQAEKDRDEESKRSRVAEARLTGGSRFNLRYTNRVPARITPGDVVAALSEYVDFENTPRRTTSTSTASSSASANTSSSTSSGSGDLGVLRKGLLREDAERAFGRPTSRSQKRDGTITTVTLVFETGESKITADFIEDVLIRYSVSSR